MATAAGHVCVELSFFDSAAPVLRFSAAQFPISAWRFPIQRGVFSDSPLCVCRFTFSDSRLSHGPTFSFSIRGGLHLPRHQCDGPLPCLDVVEWICHVTYDGLRCASPQGLGPVANDEMKKKNTDDSAFVMPWRDAHLMKSTLCFSILPDSADAS